MDRKDRIVEYMKSPEYIPLKRDELIAVLGVPKEDFNEFDKLIEELIIEGKITTVRNGRFKWAGKKVLAGILRCNKNGFFGFLEAEDGGGDVFIAGEKFFGAIDGDRVLVGLEKSSRESREGRVINIIKRGRTTLTGEIVRVQNKVYRIKPDNRSIFSGVSVEISPMAEVGDRVLLEITEFSKNGDIEGKIIKNLGKAEELKSFIEAKISEYGIKSEFDPDTLAEAKTTPKEVTDIGDRRDLRDELIFTIDGDDARDFDDAVSLEELPNGNFKLGVHIADVTHYVREGSAIDREVRLRGTSVYLADRVIPMLPIELSNGICSLNPQVDRYTLSVNMEIDKGGNVVSHEIFKGVIRSKRRLTYNIVAELLESDDENLKKEYQDVLPTLKLMKKVSSYINRKRFDRGSINFDFPESKIIVDKDGYPKGIEKVDRNIAHKIIEEFMLVANETVAEFAFWGELPFVYRVHEVPTAEKTESFVKFLLNFGLSLKGRWNKEEGVHPKTLQGILDKILGTPEEAIISKHMLRSLMKAEYKEENLGHFGLAAKYYCHFTSPIRRYPDLTVHRILKDFLDGKDTEKYWGEVGEISKISSKTERDAELCERDVDDIMKAQYMSKFIGEVYEGSVSGITKFGLFIELDNTVEGLIRLENLHDDYYEFDETRQILVGRRKKKILSIGDRMSVMVARCDLLMGSIDFLPANATIGEVNQFYKNTIKRKEEIKKSRRKGRRTYKR